jgi:predicted aspartyl protease
VEVAGQIASKTFSALVDTGFDVELGLHHQDPAKPGLKSDTQIRIDYADGERVHEPVCPARVLWHGKWKDIEVVLSTDEEPAIGTQLLQGSVATLDFVKIIFPAAKPTSLPARDYPRQNRERL